MKIPIFKDVARQAEFDQDGFTKLSVFSVQEIEALKALCANYFPNNDNVFFSSSYLDDFDKKMEMSNAITSFIKPIINKHFTDYRLIGSAFLIKGTGPKSEMPMHQDWTIIDEHEFYAANVWIPLIETNEENGTIEVLKGSHNWNEGVRAPTLPFFFHGLEEDMKKGLTVIPAKIGEIVVLNQAVVHYSKPNLSDTVRPAITCGLISEKAPLRFHYWSQERSEEIELFEQEDDFLLRFEHFHEAIYKRPLMGKSLGFKPYQHPKLTRESIYDLIGEPLPTDLEKKKPSLLARIFGRS